jgi:mycothiol synthase
MPEGYAIRPADPSDLEAVTRVAVACDLRDWGTAAVEPQDILDDWHRPSFDLARDSVVVTTGADEVVAYCFVVDERDHAELESWGAVHPAHGGRGLGTLVLERTEERARQHAALAPGGRATFRTSVAAVDRTAIELVRSRGFTRVRSWWFMQRELDPSFQADPPPPGVRIEPMAAGRDERAVHCVLEEAFSEHWGFVPTPFDEWRRQNLERPGFDPSLWLLAWEESRLVGVGLGTTRLGMGWVSDLGVLPPWRGRGIASTLLHGLFAEFAHRDYARVGLGVDAQNDTGATSLYEKAGMRVVYQFDRYEKELRAGGSGASTTAGDQR